MEGGEEVGFDGEPFEPEAETSFGAGSPERMGVRIPREENRRCLCTHAGVEASSFHGIGVKVVEEVEVGVKCVLARAGELVGWVVIAVFGEVGRHAVAGPGRGFVAGRGDGRLVGEEEGRTRG